ncbi:MAG: beta-ketoacyl synthase N-terminal-like domain-containing protein, partial [Mycobacterium sp.]
DRPSPEASRPFDAERDGFVMGEGAGILVLEEREHALARGAFIYAEVIGHASTCDAGHLTDPDPTGSGAARAIALALADAQLTPDDVDYVNAHATSTPAGDRAEATALAAAGLVQTPVSATKAAHGHALGAAGGVEAVVTALALARQVMPATRNLEHPDGDVALAHIRTPRMAQIDVAISNSFGFGGHNACLAMRAHRVAG